MKSHLRLSLRGRLVLTLLAAVGVALLVTALTLGGLVVYLSQPGGQTDRSLFGRLSNVQERATRLSAIVSEGGSQDALRSAAAIADLPPHARVLLIDLQGRLWYDSDGRAGEVIAPDQVLRWLPNGQESMSSLVTTAPVWADGLLWGYYVYIPPSANQTASVPRQNGTPINRVAGYVMMMGQAFALLVSVLLFWNLGRSLVRPLRRLSAVVGRVADGDLSARAGPTTRSDELGQLARDVDRMTAALEAAQRQAAAAEQARRYTLAAVSHDLRTPLTALMAHAEALSGGLSDDPALSAAVILDKGRQMSGLIDDLFDLASLEADRGAWRTAPADVAEMVRQAVIGVLPQIEAAGAEVEADIPDGRLMADLPPGKLERVVDNLLSNAVRYGAGGGWVGVRARGTEDRVRIEVADHGPGVPQDEQARIFDPFYRSDASRSTSVRGSGLGLAVARMIVERLGGRIGVSSPTDGGALFWVEVPRQGPPAVPALPRES